MQDPRSLNPDLPVREIKLDVERLLCYPLYSLERLRSEHGVDLFNASGDDSKDKLWMKASAAVIWAGLIAQDPTLKLDSVMMMLHFGNLTKASTLAREAFDATLESLQPATEEPQKSDPLPVA